MWRPMSSSKRGRIKQGLSTIFLSDLLDKPVDTAYGPYADGFPEEQHKYGPFAPIRAEIERLKGDKEKAH